MDQLISTFHIDIPLVVAQFINFGLVFLVLYFFAIKPLLKLMDKRSETIEEGLKNAELSEQKKKESQEHYDEVLSSAKKEANNIVSLANDKAEQEKKDILASAQKEKDLIIEKAQEQINKNQSQAELEFRTKSSEIVVSSLEKMFDGYVQKGQGDELIKKIVEK